MVISKKKFDVNDELRCKQIKFTTTIVCKNVLENFVARVVLIKESMII